MACCLAWHEKRALDEMLNTFIEAEMQCRVEYGATGVHKMQSLELKMADLAC